MRRIAYWVTTALTAFVFLSGGVMDILQPPDVIKGMTKLGYTAYFTTILGVWKVLGAIAVLAPRLPRLKEWAYAGMFFDLSGASASHAAVGDPVANIVTPLVLLGIVMASWALRPESRRLVDNGRSLESPPGGQTMRSAMLSVAAVLWMALPAAAQDPVKVDPAHHKIEFENDQVRVIRVTIPAGGKTLVHEHPNSVGVYLNDTRSRVSPVGGKASETTRKAGEVISLPATKHVVENLGATTAEIVMVELKGTAKK
jgi:quercetin dioxygenase-like cupin family protein